MNEETRLDFDDLNSSITNWKTINDSFGEACSGKFSSGFSSYYLATNCINEIENSIKAILEFSLNEQSCLYNLINVLSPQAENPTNPRTGGGGGGGMNVGDKSSDAPDDVSDGKEIKDDNETDEIEADSIEGELKELAKLKNLTLEELLADDKYSDEIKKIALKSQNISDDLKEVLMKLDSSIVREFLAAMLNKGGSDFFQLNSLNLDVIFNYLQSVAEKNGIPVNDLITNPKYANLLKSALNDCNDASELFEGLENIDSSEAQEGLLAVYTGDVPENMPEGSMEMARSFVDTLVEQSSVPYEELLTDTSYADTLQEATQMLGSASDFFGLLSNASSEEMRSVLSSRFNI